MTESQKSNQIRQRKGPILYRIGAYIQTYDRSYPINEQNQKTNTPNLKHNDKILRYKHLKDINLSGRKLEQLDFANVDFGKANFCDAELHGCDLSGANFDGANFNYAVLKNVNLSGANLSQVKGLLSHRLRNCKIDKDTKLPENFQLPNGTIVSGFTEYSDTNDIKLTADQFLSKHSYNYYCVAQKDVLRYRVGAKIKEGGNEITITKDNQKHYRHPLNDNEKYQFYKGQEFWEKAYLYDYVDFTDVSLDNRSIYTKSIENSNFTRASLCNVEFAPNLSFCNVDFTDADLRGANLSEAKNLYRVKSWKGCKINYKTKLPQEFKFPVGMIVEDGDLPDNMKLQKNQEFGIKKDDKNNEIYTICLKKMRTWQSVEVKPQEAILEQKKQIEAETIFSRAVDVLKKEEVQVKYNENKKNDLNDLKNQKNEGGTSHTTPATLTTSTTPTIPTTPPIIPNTTPTSTPPKAPDQKEETPPSTKFVFTGFTAFAKRFMNFISCGALFKDFVSKYNEQKKSQKDVNQERK